MTLPVQYDISMKGINVELNASSDTTQISLNDTLVRTLFQNLNGEKGQISMQEGLGKSNIKPPVNVLLSKILQNTATVTWERYIDLPTNGQITFYQVDVRDLNNNQVFFNANVTKVLTGLHSVDITGLVAVTDHSLAHNYIVKVIACNGNVLSNKETIVNLLTLEVAAGKASTPVVAYIPLNERHGLRITSSVANATSYNIYEMISGVAQKLNLSPIVAATLSYDHIGLDSYSSHIYKVEGISTGNTTVAGTAYSVNIQLSDACAPFLTLPNDPIPAVFTTPVSTKDTITIGWTDSTSPRVSKYHLLVKNTDTLAVIYDQDTQNRSTVSVPLTGLTVNQEYTVLLTTINEASLFYGTTFTTTRSAWTTTNAVTPAPTASVLADPTLGQRQLSVSWTTVTGGLSYKLSRTGPQLVGGVLTTTTQTFAVSPTTVGTTATFIDGDPANPPLNELQSYSFYTYTVTSVNAGGDALPSVASNPTQTKAGPANAVTVSVSLVDILDTSITVRWTDPAGQIDTFNAILKTAGGVQVGTAVSVTWVNGQTNYSATFSTSITQDTVYYVTVQTLNSNTPASADSAQFRTKITTPTGVITLANNGKVKLDLSWTALIGVTPTGYNLTRVDTTNAYSGSIGTISGSGPWTATVTITGTFVGFATGASFIATNSAGQVGGPPTLIVIGTVTSTGFTYTITNGLTPVAGAISSIYPATNLNSVTTSGSGPITYTDTSLTSFNEYKYSWSAVNAGGASGRSPYSLPLRTLPDDPVVVTNLAIPIATITTTGATITWTKATGQVTKYRVQVVQDANGQSYLDNTNVSNTTTSIDATGLTSAKSHTVTVTTYNEANPTTGISTSKSFTTKVTQPSAPVVATASAQTSLSVTWNAKTGADSHDLKRYTASGSSTITGVSSSPYADSSLSAITEYWYTLIAQNGGGASAESAISNKVTTWADKAPVPGTPTASPADWDKMTVSWAAVTVPSGVTVNYKVLRYPGAIDLGDVSSTSLTDTSLSEHSDYTYRVQSWTTGGYSTSSSASDTATTYYKIPGNPTIAANGVTGITYNSFTITWTKGSGTIISQNVIASALGHTTKLSGSLSANDTSYTFTGLDSDITYTIQVWEYSNNANGAGSASTTATTLVAPPAKPTIGSCTGISSSSVTVNWTNVTGVTYQVFRGGTADANSIATGQTGSSYADNSVTYHTDYTYYVRGSTSGGNSPFSDAATASTPYPTELVVVTPTPVEAGNNITVTMSNGVPEDTYSLEVTGTAIINGLWPWTGTLNSSGAATETINDPTSWGSLSAKVTFTTTTHVITSTAITITKAAPDSAVTIGTVTIGATSLTIPFTYVSSTKGPVEGVKVVGTGISGSTTTLSNNAGTITASNLTSGTAYTFGLATYNSAHDGPTSSTVTKTPLAAPATPTITVSVNSIPLSITFTSTGAESFLYNISTTAYGTPATSINATSGSASVTFSPTATTSYYISVNAVNSASTSGLVQVTKTVTITSVALAWKFANTTWTVVPGTVISIGLYGATGGGGGADSSGAGGAGGTASYLTAPNITVPAGVTSVTYTHTTGGTAGTNYCTSAVAPTPGGSNYGGRGGVPKTTGSSGAGGGGAGAATIALGSTIYMVAAGSGGGGGGSASRAGGVGGSVAAGSSISNYVSSGIDSTGGATGNGGGGGGGGAGAGSGGSGGSAGTDSSLSSTGGLATTNYVGTGAAVTTLAYAAGGTGAPASTTANSVTAGNGSTSGAWCTYKTYVVS